MRYLLIFFLGVFFSLNLFGQNKLSELDSTNYKKLLLKVENVNEKLNQKFSNQEFQKLVNLIGSDFETFKNGDSRFIRNKKQLNKKNIKAIGYELKTINFDSSISHPSFLVVVLKKNKIIEIYTSSLSIRGVK
jgi:hypothetical protein